ncbi:uncharacterized protein LOC128956882 [Oppia nitens]|uniref:uncharacterized protein LOC128956882 n=1 Tax=Oppia nitens TaxID=1686743 RepID=UPI0023D97B39|nr:uncharacterized protein LOC128956882 [Oppia nitens]
MSTTQSPEPPDDDDSTGNYGGGGGSSSSSSEVRQILMGIVDQVVDTNNNNPREQQINANNTNRYIINDDKHILLDGTVSSSSSSSSSSRGPIPRNSRRKTIETDSWYTNRPVLSSPTPAPAAAAPVPVVPENSKSTAANKVVLDDHQYLNDHRPDLNATVVRRPRARNRTKTIETTDRYIPPAPVLDRSKSTNQLPNQLSTDFYGQLQTKTTGQQHFLLNQLRLLAPPPRPTQQQAFMTGPGPHLFMSGLDGYHGTGPRGSQVKGELFQHNYPIDTIESALTDNDYQQLCQELAYYGFHLDSQHNVIGQGHFGKVVSGTYGPNIKNNLMAIEAEYLNVDDNLDGVQEGQRFAAKYIHFTQSSSLFNRCRLNMEKLVMKQIGRHPNCVTYRMAINLGHRELIAYRGSRFYSYEHTLLIMDWADHGDLDRFIVNGQYTVGLCIQFMRDLLAGLRYLHGLRITHNDIHAGNVLIFTTTTPPPTTTTGISTINYVVAKWADFGLAQIHKLAKNQYLSDRLISDWLTDDLKRLSKLFLDTMIPPLAPPHYPLGQPGHLLPELVEWTRLANDLLSASNINVIYQRYPYLIG